ncbi:hypothetical protein THIOSC15_2750005 [uncultured Thiomicrorhabdus sp.]
MKNINTIIVIGRSLYEKNTFNSCYRIYLHSPYCICSRPCSRRCC